jgi:chromosome segregation protein
MRLKSIELSGFKSFAKKTTLQFGSAITSIVGPNGSGKSNIAESFRFVLGEQSMKSMRGKRSEDLIWNGSTTVPRAGRAGVKLIFDNADRALNLDFDEVAIERVVHRDGASDYLLNGSMVRLRDINELLSQANIGSSGHHIISQGEADRVLSAGSRERREMLEDALGLTSYLYKREEAGKKLEKTADNMREVASLRRELAPHLKFLAGQVKKIEQAQVLRGELAGLYAEYLLREERYLHRAKETLKAQFEAPQRDLRELVARIEHLRHELGKKHDDAGAREIMRLEEEGRAVSRKQEAAARELGAIEGELRAHERLAKDAGGTVPAAEARSFAERVLSELEGKGNIQALIVLAKEFLRRIVAAAPNHSTEELRAAKTRLESDLHTLKKEEEATRAAVARLRAQLESEKDLSRDAERELFAAMAKRSELESVLAGLRSRGETLAREEEQYKIELREAGALLGTALRLDQEPAYGEEALAGQAREAQADRRRKLERLKIRLEESGMAGASDVLKEHEETAARDAFLNRELSDLEASAAKLRELIDELTKTLETRFVDGIDKINTEFDAFFKLMFGGGSAALQVVTEKKIRRAVPAEAFGEGGAPDVDEDDVEVEEGIDISVSLPHKRIKGLHMLSGGERALTSIALIFAMSQVNPPPFLILDETDAALDEANSRRYGDMIENLARKSQLIVVTHNRETMSRAGVLYGITMGSDGVSKLLSVKFEEALAVAK